MMSFGGGWFFVAQSEAISVLNKNIKLPGLGSYMAAAVEAGDTRAAVYAIVAMIVTIVVLDQLAVAAAGRMGRKVQARADRRQGQSDIVGAGSAAALVRAGMALRARRSRARSASRSAPRCSASDVTQTDLRPHTRHRSRRCCASRCGHWSRLGVAWLVFDAIDIAKEIRTDMTRRADASRRLARRADPAAGRGDERDRDADLDADRRLDRTAATRGAHCSAARADRRVVSGEHDISVHRRVLHRGAHPDQPGQRAAHGARHAVVHPVQRHRRCDGDPHRPARGRQPCSAFATGGSGRR